jgi:hypothetical protein
VGDDSHLCFSRNCRSRTKCKTGCCHGETVGSVLAKVRGDVFARFHAVAAIPRSRTRNSQLGLLGPVLRATTTAPDYFGYTLVHFVKERITMPLPEYQPCFLLGRSRSLQCDVPAQVARCCSHNLDLVIFKCNKNIILYFFLKTPMSVYFLQPGTVTFL